jgi:hypothetical protein
LIFVGIILIILGILYWRFHRRDSDDVIHEIKQTRTDLVDAISGLGDKLGGKIDKLGTRIGGGNATTEDQTNKEQTSKTKKESEKKGGKA